MGNTTRRTLARLAAAGVLAASMVIAADAVTRNLSATGVAQAAGSSCTPSSPGVTIANTWAWSSWGSWGLPGQRLTYEIDIRNYDVGCNSSTFVIGLSAPGGFAVSIPTNTITLNSYSSGSLWAHVTSASGIGDGDYPLVATVQRVGTSNSGTPFTSYYKVYSTDSVPPTLYWPSPGNGETVSTSKGNKSYNVMVSSTDDHEVKKIDLYLDNAYTSTTLCDDISYSCQLVYKWPLTGVSGQHTATFKSYDWLGNVGVLTVTFTVS